MKQSAGVLESTVRLVYKSGMNYREAVQCFRRAFLVHALAESANGSGRPNQCRVAKQLGLHRNTLMRQISELGIAVDRPNYRARR